MMFVRKIAAFLFLLFISLNAVIAQTLKASEKMLENTKLDKREGTHQTNPIDKKEEKKNTDL